MVQKRNACDKGCGRNGRNFSTTQMVFETLCNDSSGSQECTQYYGYITVSGKRDDNSPDTRKVLVNVACGPTQQTSTVTGQFQASMDIITLLLTFLIVVLLIAITYFIISLRRRNKADRRNLMNQLSLVSRQISWSAEQNLQVNL